MLTIQNLTKHYKGSDKGITNLNLQLDAGDIYGFIGHNGAGKMTTLKCVAGIHAFDAGEIYIDGLSVHKDAMACKRKIAYIPDNPDLYEYMTGIQYLNFIADIFGVSAAERDERIRTHAKEFEISASLGDLISAYFSRDETKACDYFGAGAQAKAVDFRRAVCRLRPKGVCRVKEHDAQAL